VKNSKEEKDRKKRCDIWYDQPRIKEVSDK